MEISLGQRLLHPGGEIHRADRKYERDVAHGVSRIWRAARHVGCGRNRGADRGPARAVAGSGAGAEFLSRRG